MSAGTQNREAGLPLGTIVIALAPFALGYFMSYLFRAVNAVLSPDLVREIGLDASQLGLLTSAYLFAFALFQLPLGILLDRYGPRKVQSVLLLCAAIGAVFFSIAENVFTLTVARALIGIGFAGGLMSGFKAVVLWVPAPRRPLANAFVMSAGALGLLVATVPVEFSVQMFGWRTVLGGLAVVTAAVAVLLFAVVPRRQSAAVATGESFGKAISAIGKIYSDRSFWILAPLLCLTGGYQIAIQTLWAGPWFRDVAGLSRESAAEHLLVMAGAFFVGILLTGAIADWFVRRGVNVLSVMVGFLCLFMISQVFILFGPGMFMVPAWMTFGMFGQVAVLAYPWLSSHFGEKLSGRANTAMNLLLFSSAFASQYVMGLIIDLFPAVDGAYDARAYHTAFAVFLGLQILALGWYMMGVKRLFADSSRH